MTAAAAHNVANDDGAFEEHNCGSSIVGVWTANVGGGNEAEAVPHWWQLPPTIGADVDQRMALVAPYLVAIARKVNPF